MSESNNIITTSPVLDGAKKSLADNEFAVFQKAWNTLNLSAENLSHDTQTSLDALTKEMGVAWKWIMAKISPHIPEWNQNTGTEFLKNPLDYVEEKAVSAKNTVVEGAVSLLPDGIQAAKKANDRWASTLAVLTTAVAGESAGKIVEQGEKATSFFDKFTKNPLEAIKELFSSFMEAFKTGDWSKIKSFFSFGDNIDTDLVKTFGEKIWISKDLIRGATSFFASDSISQLSYANLQELYKRYQKNPQLDLMKELKISDGDNSEIASYLSSVFGKKGPDITRLFPEVTDTSTISMNDVIKKTVS